MNYENTHWLAVQINLCMQVIKLNDPNLRCSDAAKKLENVKCLQIVIFWILKAYNIHKNFPELDKSKESFMIKVLDALLAQ